MFVQVVASGVAPHVPDPARERRICCDAINRERARRLRVGTGIEVSWQDDPIRVSGTAVENSTFVDLLLRAQSAPPKARRKMAYRDVDNIVHRLTPAQMVELTTAALTWAEDVMSASWALKDAREIPEDWADDSHWPG